MESPTIPAPTTTTSWCETEAEAEAEGWDRRAGSGWRRRREARRERRWAREDGVPEVNGEGLMFAEEEKAATSMIGSGEKRRSGDELHCRRW